MSYNNNSVRNNCGKNSSSGSQYPNSGIKYVYDLPFFNRKELCRILDENNQWETLGGGLMGYSSSELSEFSRAIYRPGGSPTDAMLIAWGSQNHTILELFILLRRIQHFRGMRLLCDFVDPKYHVYIRDEQENATMELIQLHSQSENRTVDVKGAQKIPDAAKAEASDPKAKENVLENKLKLAESYGMLPQIPYEQLVAATNNWDRRNILGKGGFGTVFKGIWKLTDVAIKRMEQRPNHFNIESQIKQSLGELRFLNAYRHDNILPLYGYSLEGDHPCLMYQFMTNGSLEDRLLCRQKTLSLNWNLRYQISRGVACGIQFLHSISDNPLIHGDIKSANILLDRNFEAKEIIMVDVGDFGLAREMSSSQGASYVKVSRVHGTRPYLPDEYLRSKKLSTKVDTYSFGIMLFEIATGQRAYEESRPRKLLKDIIEEVENFETVRDVKAGGGDNAEIFVKLVILGKSCTRRLAKERPDMVQVLKSLEGFFSQPTSIRTVSSHVTGLPLLFEMPSRAASLVPTTASSVHRLSPETRGISDMRAVSPYWSPQQFQQQQQYGFIHSNHQYQQQQQQQQQQGGVGIQPFPKPVQTDSLGSSPRKSPLGFIPPSQSPSPQYFTNPVTVSDNNQQSNGNAHHQMNITAAENQLQLPQFVGFVPPQKNSQLQPLQPLARLPPSVNVNTPLKPVDDDYFPVMLQDQDSGDYDVRDSSKREFDCSYGPTTVIPLITELGIKDDDPESSDDRDTTE